MLGSAKSIVLKPGDSVKKEMTLTVPSNTKKKKPSSLAPLHYSPAEVKARLEAAQKAAEEKSKLKKLTINTSTDGFEDISLIGLEQVREAASKAVRPSAPPTFRKDEKSPRRDGTPHMFGRSLAQSPNSDALSRSYNAMAERLRNSQPSSIINDARKAVSATPTSGNIIIRFNFKPVQSLSAVAETATVAVAPANTNKLPSLSKQHNRS